MTEEFVYTYIRPVITFIIVFGLAYIVGSNKIKFYNDNDKNKRKRK